MERREEGEEILRGVMEGGAQRGSQKDKSKEANNTRVREGGEEGRGGNVKKKSKFKRKRREREGGKKNVRRREKNWRGGETKDVRMEKTGNTDKK